MKKDKKKTKFNIILLIVFIILFCYSISLVAMLAWGFVTSLKSRLDFETMGNVLGWPDNKLSADAMRLSNYLLVFKSFQYTLPANDYTSIFGTVEKADVQVNFGLLVFNSLAYAGVGSLIQVFTVTTVAYICSKYKYKFTELMYVVALIVMIIPIVGAYPSEIKVLQDLGLYNTYIGMWVQKMNYTGIYFFVLYAFFKGMPDSYIEAAEIDGASQFSTYIRIVLPLAAKVISTVLLITFIDYWNNYQVALLYFPSIPTLAFGVFNIQDQVWNQNTELNGAWGVPQKIAACMTLAIPLIVLFVALRNKILGDVSLGGLKE